MTRPDSPLRSLAFSLVASSWPGLDDDRRDDVLDTMFYGEYLNAIEVMLQSSAALDPGLVRRARAELAAHPA